MIIENHLVEKAIDELKTYFSTRASLFKIQILHFTKLPGRETCYTTKCNNRRKL